MRVLLIGVSEYEKALHALQRDRILTDHLTTPDPTLTDGENIYDVILYFVRSIDAEIIRILHSLRKNGVTAPILVVAAHAAARDRIQGLEAGADDILTEPFIMGELLARVHALARRASFLQPRLLETGDLTLDRGHYLLHCNANEIRLSGKEMQILELFLLNPGQTLTRELLQQKVWGYDSETSYNNIEVYISLVRRKLRAIGSSLCIHAQRGIGYYLENPASAQKNPSGA